MAKPKMKYCDECDSSYPDMIMGMVDAGGEAVTCNDHRTLAKVHELSKQRMSKAQRIKAVEKIVGEWDRVEADD